MSYDIRERLFFDDILKAARDTDFESLVSRDSIEHALFNVREMWTWYCEANDIECDTHQYDVCVASIWKTLKEHHSKAFSRYTFDTFDLYMGVYLC